VTQANCKIAKYFESRGRYDEAEALSKQVIEDSEKNFGTNHPDTLRSVNVFANIYLSQGRYDEAEVLHVRALEGRKKFLGNNDTYTLKSASNPASVRSSQGRYDGFLHER
jgi:tetratricopeptide (TPR) repeat protein